MVWCRANRPQQYIKILKEVTIEAIRLKILRAKELIVKGVKAKLKSQQKKIFKQTLQQNKQFKERASIKYKKQEYYTRDYR